MQDQPIDFAGLVAFYDQDEADFMAALKERFLLDRATTLNELEVIHTLKALFPGGRLLSEQPDAHWSAR